MLDKTIPYHGVYMYAGAFRPYAAPLPADIRIVFYTPGDENPWADIECSVGEFDSLEAARRCFEENYLPHADLLRKRCVFAETARGEKIATCTAWQDTMGGRTVSSLHWLGVKPAYQGRGVGGALVLRVMEVFRDEDAYPVYLHSQTWSHRALPLYHRAGFRLMRQGCFDHAEGEYVNEYEKAINVLEKVLESEKLRMLRDTSV